MQVDDKVKITAQGIEYNEGRVTSVNDSTVVIRQGWGSREEDYFYNIIRIDEIENLIIKQKDKKKTIHTVIGSVLWGFIIVAIVWLGKMAHEINKI
jgi:hypothetical protein